MGDAAVHLASLAGHVQLRVRRGELLLQRLPLPPVPWLSDPTWAFIAPIICNIWLGFPFMMIVALGGLAAIPGELYEAAELDGASAWDRFRNITWPQILPVMTPAVILGTIWTFNNMLVVWLVSRGGEPADHTHILVTYIYKVAFTSSRYSYAAAFSVVVFVLLLGCAAHLPRSAVGGAREPTPTSPRRALTHAILIASSIATVLPDPLIVTCRCGPPTRSTRPLGP